MYSPITQARIPISGKNFSLSTYDSGIDYAPHLALSLNLSDDDPSPVLLRIHSECLTGDIFGSQRCDCGNQLNQALNSIISEGRGIIIYLRQEGRGIGLVEKLNCYNVQDQGYDTYDANTYLGHPPDSRNYDIAIKILKQLNIQDVNIMTNNPQKINALLSSDIRVTKRLELNSSQEQEASRYLSTKKHRFGHLIELS